MIGDETDVESDSEDEWEGMRWGNPDWYSMEQWEGIMAGVLKEHEDWQKELKKEQRHKYYEANKEKAKEQVRKWDKANPTKVRESKRKWNKANPDKVRESTRKSSRKWDKANPEKARERRRKSNRKLKQRHYKCRTCKVFLIQKRGQECAGCGGYRINSAEYELRDYLREWYPNAVFDKQMEGSCLQYRPDTLIETLWGCLVIEVDEQQHESYDPKCEVVREFNIWQSLGCVVTFIRYNPDSYKPDNFNTQRLTKEERLSALFLTLQEAYETHRPGLHIQYLWYSPARIAELEAARSKLPK